MKPHWRCVCKHTLQWHPEWANRSCIGGQDVRCSCEYFDASGKFGKREKDKRNAIVDGNRRPNAD